MIHQPPVSTRRNAFRRREFRSLACILPVLAIQIAAAPFGRESQAESTGALVRAQGGLLLDARVGGDSFRIDIVKIDAAQLDAAIEQVKAACARSRTLWQKGNGAECAEAYRAWIRHQGRLELLSVIRSQKGRAAEARARIAELEKVRPVHAANGAKGQLEAVERDLKKQKATVESVERGIDLDRFRFQYKPSRADHNFYSDCLRLAYDVTHDPVRPVNRKGQVVAVNLWEELGKQIVRAHENCASLAKHKQTGNQPNELAVQYDAYMEHLNSLRRTWEAGDRAGVQRTIDQDLERFLDLREIDEAPKLDAL